ncbi:MAG: hypothetical protein Q7J68_07000 [Thermoplasmata archaeon]|nr:hypothetical protein [Thermoplasmata archaeon]
MAPSLTDILVLSAPTSQTWIIVKLAHQRASVVPSTRSYDPIQKQK